MAISLPNSLVDACWLQATLTVNDEDPETDPETDPERRHESDNLLFLHALNAPKFPHDPTLNQFLDQHQIHAYQLLGQRSASQALQALAALPDLPPQEEAEHNDNAQDM